MIVVPVRQPLPVQLVRWLVRGVLILVGVGVVLNIAAWIAAHQSSVTVDKEHPYLWRSGSPIYLAADRSDGFWCMVTTGDVVGREVRLPGTLDILEMSAPGRQINPPRTPVAEVNCDHKATISSGRLLVLFQVASWPWFVPAGFLLCFSVAFLAWRGLWVRLRGRWGNRSS